tara:strand:- start:990 stop:1358 length:369 start_codon:yes stop_codon:yes gene_type:complete
MLGTVSILKLRAERRGLSSYVELMSAFVVLSVETVRFIESALMARGLRRRWTGPFTRLPFKTQRPQGGAAKTLLFSERRRSVSFSTTSALWEKTPPLRLLRVTLLRWWTISPLKIQPLDKGL